MNKELILKFCPLWERFNCYCYGTGEKSILESLKEAFNAFESYRNYYIYDIEKIMTKLKNPALSYFIIIVMDHANFISWGTSIRHGFTENGGSEFVKLILENSIEELYEAALIDEETQIDLGIIKYEDNEIDKHLVIKKHR